MSDSALLRLTRPLRGIPRTLGRPVALSRPAVATLASEVTRNPGPKNVLVVAATTGPATIAVLDRLAGHLMPGDHLTIQLGDTSAIPALRARFAARTAPNADYARLAPRTRIVTDEDAIGEADAVVIAEPLPADPTELDIALDSFRPVLSPGGTISLAHPALARLAPPASAVRSDLVIRNFPPLRVHHLRFDEPAPDAAVLLGPAHSPSHLSLTRMGGIDSTAAAVVAVGGALSLATKIVRPRSRWWWILPALVSLPVAAAFRDPRRIVPYDTEAVLSVSDGVIQAVERTIDARFGPKPWLRITVLTGVRDARISRAPAAGRITGIAPGAVETNSAHILTMDTPHGPIVVAREAGPVPGQVVSRVRPGALVSAGERVGLLRLGSRTDVYLPADAVEPAVAPGDHVLAGETILARFLL